MLIFSLHSLVGHTSLCWSWSLSLTSSSIICLRGWSGESANIYSNAQFSSDSCALTSWLQLVLNASVTFLVFNRFIVPISCVICNDIMAYMFGFFFGRTPLIKVGSLNNIPVLKNLLLQTYFGKTLVNSLYRLIISTFWAASAWYGRGSP